MNVLIGYESSGVVRSAFRALGHDAWSCDFLDAEDGSRYHLKCNVFSVARSACWDMGVFHPPCTYLAGSTAWAFGDGPYHQKVKPGTRTGAARPGMPCPLPGLRPSPVAAPSACTVWAAWHAATAKAGAWC